MKSAVVLPVSAIWDFSQIDSVMNKSLLRLDFDSSKQNITCPWWGKTKTKTKNPQQSLFLCNCFISSVPRNKYWNLCRLSLKCITYLVVRKISIQWNWLKLCLFTFLSVPWAFPTVNAEGQAYYICSVPPSAFTTNQQSLWAPFLWMA